MTFSITTLNIMTLSIIGLFATLSTTVLRDIMLSVGMFYCYAECRYADCRYAESRDAASGACPKILD